MQALILVIHVLAAIAIIILVLLQHGKGADVGAVFGSGGSNTMFGSVGSMSFFMKLTSILAAIFFATSLTLSYLASHQRALPILNIPAAPVSVPTSVPAIPIQPSAPPQPSAPTQPQPTSPSSP